MFIQSPGSACSFERTSSSTSTFTRQDSQAREGDDCCGGAPSSASQAYFRKWGQWSDAASTTTFYSTTRMTFREGRVEEMDTDTEQETRECNVDDHAARAPVDKAERIQRELVVMLHVQRCADLDMVSWVL